MNNKTFRLVIVLALALLNNSFCQENNYFVAMEYRGISNLIYKVIVFKDKIVGVKTNGYISVANSYGIGYVVPMKDLNDPNAYMRKYMENFYNGIDEGDTTGFLKIDRENFLIHKKNIKRVYHNPNNKWGMGYYPHNGRIIIKTLKTGGNNRKNREFILVGEQDEKRILRILE